MSGIPTLRAVSLVNLIFLCLLDYPFIVSVFSAFGGLRFLGNGIIYLASFTQMCEHLMAEKVCVDNKLCLMQIGALPDAEKAKAKY